ncbi:MAG: transporter [Bacteroidetes bacterium]|nr:MAG: transporter [Bacteroidota bacterium]
MTARTVFRLPLIAAALPLLPACSDAPRPETLPPDKEEAVQEAPPAPRLRQSRLEIFHLEERRRETVWTSPERFEAPNWSPDGRFLLFNKNGFLFRFDLRSRTPAKIPTGFADHCNNDHGISPDGRWIILSHNRLEDDSTRRSAIYAVPIEGGTPRLVTPNTPSYWHGISPDGKTLAYVGLRNGDFDIFTIPFEGGEEKQLTFSPGLDDGPDYSPDGRFIYYNSAQSGTMEIWRMEPDGGNPEQLTSDRWNNWFPHPDPSGRFVLFLTYVEPIDPQTHPPDKQVKLRLLDLQTLDITELAAFTGGQGTLNVPCWRPDGKAFAFVSYEVEP